MNTEIREQRISLRIEGQTLLLRVPATEEANYRRGAEELNLTLERYRQRYHGDGSISSIQFLAMAAVDVAYRSELWKAAAAREQLGERLEALAQRAENTWAEHQYHLEQLKKVADEHKP